MAISFNTLISALDTPNSLAPFFIKDGFDITGRTVMAQREGGKHEAREKFIEEAGTSIFWIGGIPAVRGIINHFFKDKIDPDIQFKRINSDGIQGYFADKALETIVDTVELGSKMTTKKKFSAEDLKGIVFDGEKLGQITEKLNKKGVGFYKKYHTGVTAAAVFINLAILTVAIPKLNQLLSRKIISKEVNGENTISEMNTSDTIRFGNNNKVEMDNFLENSKINQVKNKTAAGQTSFKGGFSDLFNFKDLLNFTKMAENAQMEPVCSMLLLDYGISGGRVAITPRNNSERIENAVKEGGIIYFFYFAAAHIKTWLAKCSDKMLNIPIDLDYKILNDGHFLNRLKSPHSKEELLKFCELEKDDPKAEIKVIKMIDEELSTSTKESKIGELFKNFSLQMAQKEGLIDVEYDNQLQKWIRHSKKYIQTDKVIQLNENLKNFYEKALEQIQKGASKTDIEKIISKTKKIKMAAVFGNMAICCASLSFIVPKIQYMIREHRTKTKSAPGIKLYQDLAKNNQLVV